MTQTLEKLTVLKSPEVEEIDVQIAHEDDVDELLGDLNPRYFEEIITLKEAKERAYASDINVGSKLNFFSAY